MKQLRGRRAQRRCWWRPIARRLRRRPRSFGGRVELTSPDCASGTDRVAEIARKLPDVEIIVNVQGDEPEISAAAIDLAVELLERDPRAVMSTLATPIREQRAAARPGLRESDLRPARPGHLLQPGADSVRPQLGRRRCSRPIRHTSISTSACTPIAASSCCSWPSCRGRRSSRSRIWSSSACSTPARRFSSASSTNRRSASTRRRITGRLWSGGARGSAAPVTVSVSGGLIDVFKVTHALYPTCGLLRAFLDGQPRIDSSLISRLDSPKFLYIPLSADYIIDHQRPRCYRAQFFTLNNIGAHMAKKAANSSDRSDPRRIRARPSGTFWPSYQMPKHPSRGRREERIWSHCACHDGVHDQDQGKHGQEPQAPEDARAKHRLP